MLHSATGSQLPLERADSMCESGVARRLVLDVSWVVVVRERGVV
jgi:hypothetical protein